MLRPFRPGNTFGRNAEPSRYNEIVALALGASPDPIRMLVERLGDPDGRIAVVIANSLLAACRTYSPVGNIGYTRSQEE